MNAATIAFLGLALIAGGAFLLFQGYEGSSVAMSAAAWVSIICGALVLLFGLSRKGASVLQRQESAPAELEQAHVEIRSLIKAMAATAVADGRIAKREVKTICAIHQKIIGTSITTEDVNEILAQYPAGSDAVADIENDRADISPTMKRKIVEACHLVMVSDLEIAPSEDSKVHQIGRALGFSNAEIEDILAATAV